MTDRIGTGKAFHPLDPRPEDIDVRDVPSGAYGADHWHPSDAADWAERTIIEEVREDQPWLLDGYEQGYRAGWGAALAWASAGSPTPPTDREADR